MSLDHSNIKSFQRGNFEYSIRAQTRKKYLLVMNICTCIFAILKSGLRNIKNLPLSNDTPNFLHQYNEVLHTSWTQLINNYSLISTDYGNRDLGFPLFIKLTQCISTDFQFFMILVATIFIVPLARLIYQYLHTYTSMILAWMIYFSLFTVVTDSFMRQAVALGIIISGFGFIYKRQWKSYYLLNLIAFTIHSSAILAAPLYFLPYSKRTRNLLFIFIASVPVLLTNTKLLAILIASNNVYEDYASSLDAYNKPVTFTILISLVAIFSLIFYKKIIATKNGNFLIIGIALATILTPMAWINPTILRSTYYYSIFIIPLIPTIIDTIKISENLRKIIYVFTITFLLFLICK